MTCFVSRPSGITLVKFHMSIVAKINTTEYASCVRANFSMSPAYCHASILATTFVSPSAVPCVVFVIVIVLYVHHFNCSLLVSCVFTRSSLSSVYIVSIITSFMSYKMRIKSRTILNDNGLSSSVTCEAENEDLLRCYSSEASF